MSGVPLRFVTNSMDLFDSIPTERGDLHTASGLLRLMALPGVGPKRAVELAERFSDWATLRDADRDDVFQLLRGKTDEARDAIFDGVSVPEIPDEVRTIGCFDADWPDWLLGCPTPPAVIFVRGTLPPGGSLGVVGTRHPTRFGLRVVDQVVHHAADRGIGVVSGLALGIDTAAHVAALQYETPTWAILGGGVDRPTPRENANLAEQILECGGGLLSEQLPGTAPTPASLVARNRMQAAASSALVVAQCGIPSGTLHTARFALQQGVPLVVPRPREPWDQEPESAGNIALADPNGCRPDIIHATGKLAVEVGRRAPVADLVLESADDIEKIWD